MIGRPNDDLPSHDLGKLILPLEERTPKIARDFVAQLACSFGLVDIEYRLKLAVSEIVTNALMHAAQEPAATVKVVTSRAGKQFRVTIHDSSSQPPVALYPTGDEESGRGLILVSDITDGCGHYPTEFGKAVWFDIAADWPSQVTGEILVHACSAGKKCEHRCCGGSAAVWFRLEAGGLAQYCVTHWQEIATAFTGSGHTFNYTAAAYNRLRDHRTWETP